MKSIFRMPVIILVLVFGLFIGDGIAQLDLTLSPSLEMAQIVYVSDFDFLQVGGAELLFTLNLTAQPPRGRFVLRVVKDGDEIASANTNYFTLAASDIPLMLNNIQLSDGITIGSGATIEYDETNTSYPTQDFEDDVFQSGKLPRGRYIIIIAYELEQGGTWASDQEILDILNPTYINLVTPGNQSGFGDPEEVYTQFPIMQFDTDLQNPQMSATDPFHVQVFKKLEQHSSLDEALTGTPHLDFFTNQTVFQYPSGEGEQPLDPGVYVWRVRMRIITSGGIEEIESPIYLFKVVDPDDASEDNLLTDYEQILRDLLGDRAEVIVQNLDDYKLISIRVNGEQMTKAQIYEIIDTYEGQLVDIIDIIIQNMQN